MILFQITKDRKYNKTKEYLDEKEIFKIDAIKKIEKNEI